MRLTLVPEHDRLTIQVDEKRLDAAIATAFKDKVRDLIDGVYSDKGGGTDSQVLAAEMARARVEDMSEKDVSREIKRLEKLMLEHARNLEFEQAARVRDQLHVLKQSAFGAPGADNLRSIAGRSAA